MTAPASALDEGAGPAPAQTRGRRPAPSLTGRAGLAPHEHAGPQEALVATSTPRPARARRPHDSQPPLRLVAPGPRPAALAVSGAVWTVALIGALAAGPGLVVAVVTPVCLIASLSAVRAATRGPGRRAAGVPPGLVVPALLAAATPAVALAGAAPAAGACLLAAGLAAGTARRRSLPAARREGSWAPRRVALAVVAPALAGASIVLATRQDTELALVLVAAVLLFDLANAVMGTGATGGVLGALSGALTVAVLAVIVQAILDPPFVGASSLVLCGAVAVLAPAGVSLCRRVAPGRVPALRRLDAFVLAGPLWVAGVGLLVPH